MQVVLRWIRKLDEQKLGSEAVTVVFASSACLDFLPQLPSRVDCKKGV